MLKSKITTVIKTVAKSIKPDRDPIIDFLNKEDKFPNNLKEYTVRPYTTQDLIKDGAGRTAIDYPFGS